MTNQRLRITYRKIAAARELTSGRLTRAWVEAFECAGIPLSRPEGSKRARIEMGPPLPQDATGEAELVDVFLAHPIPAAEVLARIRPVLPPGIEPLHAEEVGERLPSLHASMRAARYRVVLDAAEVDAAALQARVDALLALDTLDWEELRGERLRRFDLRALIYELDVREEPGAVVIEARLALSQERTARPVSVLAALDVGAAPIDLVRTAIEIERPQIALRAWRERGRFE
jgi:radical SAM-linked protein